MTSFDAFFLSLVLGLPGLALALSLLPPRSTLRPAAFAGLGLGAGLGCAITAIFGPPALGTYFWVGTGVWGFFACIASGLWAGAAQDARLAYDAAEEARTAPA